MSNSLHQRLNDVLFLVVLGRNRIEAKLLANFENLPPLSFVLAANDAVVHRLDAVLFELGMNFGNDLVASVVVMEISLAILGEFLARKEFDDLAASLRALLDSFESREESESISLRANGESVLFVCFRNRFGIRRADEPPPRRPIGKEFSRS